MQKHFADRLMDAVKKKGNPICVGLDPRLDKIPEFICNEAFKKFPKDPMKAAATAILEFNKGIIDAVADIVPVVKPQIAFYECFGAPGVQAYIETLDYAHEKDLITIADAKRNDIGSTAEAYAEAFLGETSVSGGGNVAGKSGVSGGADVAGEVSGGATMACVMAFDADSITVNGYLGSDGIKPFMKIAKGEGKGLFVLVKTSNPSSGELQDLFVLDKNCKGENAKTLYEIMGYYVDSWGACDLGESGYSFVGAVVGATYPEQAKKLREIMPNTIFLVPGYGAQGGGAADVKPCFNKDGLGAVVNSSRGIIFAYEKNEKFGPEGYAEAAREATIMMKEDLKAVV